MRFVAFEKASRPALAVKRGDDLIDLSVAAPKLPTTLAALLSGGDDALSAAQSAMDGAGAGAVVSGEVSYLPPIVDPSKILCIGLNYRDHIAENKLSPPERPVVFARFTNSIVGHGQALQVPRVSEQLDFEAELTAVIGKRAKHVSVEDALDYVAGYTIMNEGSVRDWQLRNPQWLMGKSQDAAGSLGPQFVTADELPPAAAGLHIETRLNGNVMQDSDTSQLYFSIAEIIAEITQAITLMPGDYIATGTPGGVGFFRNPPVWMKEGDVCEIEIEGLGTLRNPIVNEP
jgi:2-keto-4-pentenoate hydratase/2-oxohepta-3-ene-1,7-dioic acid hydratase in catechol pathway